MALTDIAVVLGQKLHVSFFPNGLEEDGWGFWGLDENGRPFSFEDSVLHSNDSPYEPVDLTRPISDVFVIDEAPYEEALGNEVIVGVYIHQGGDGYADISQLFTADASIYLARTEEVKAVLQGKGLPNDDVKFWVIATPHV